MPVWAGTSKRRVFPMSVLLEARALMLIWRSLSTLCSTDAPISAGMIGYHPLPRIPIILHRVKNSTLQTLQTFCNPRVLTSAITFSETHQDSLVAQHHNDDDYIDPPCSSKYHRHGGNTRLCDLSDHYPQSSVCSYSQQCHCGTNRRQQQGVCLEFPRTSTDILGCTFGPPSSGDPKTASSCRYSKCHFSTLD